MDHRAGRVSWGGWGVGGVGVGHAGLKQNGCTVYRKAMSAFSIMGKYGGINRSEIPRHRKEPL